MAAHVRIFDTTLRDGEQSPGFSLTFEQKLEVAGSSRLGVDIIEAGFPAASPATSRRCSRSRARSRARRRRPGARRPATSTSLGGDQGRRDAAPPHLHLDLRHPPGAPVPDDARGGHGAGRRDGAPRASVLLGRRVLADGRDPLRLDYLCEVIEAVIEAGATTINIPDTVGYTLPDECGELIARRPGQGPSADKAIISVHCHDDLGHGGGQHAGGDRGGRAPGRGCINGIGERAGNTALEEVVMALQRRQDFFSGFRPQIDATSSARPARCWQQFTGMAVAAEQGDRRRERLRATSPASTRTACSRTGSPTRS